MAISSGYHVARLIDSYSISEQLDKVEHAITLRLLGTAAAAEARGAELSFSIRFGEPVLLSPKADGGETALMHDVTIHVSLSSRHDETFTQEKADSMWKEIYG